MDRNLFKQNVSALLYCNFCILESEQRRREGGRRLVEVVERVILRSAVKDQSFAGMANTVRECVSYGLRRQCLFTQEDDVTTYHLHGVCLC